MKKWQKIALAFGFVSCAGALGLWAAFGDGCPASCPMHPGMALTKNTVTYNPDGTISKAECGFACGCTFTNNGGNGGNGSKNPKAMTKSID